MQHKLVTIQTNELKDENGVIIQRANVIMRVSRRLAEGQVKLGRCKMIPRKNLKQAMKRTELISNHMKMIHDAGYKLEADRIVDKLGMKVAEIKLNPFSGKYFAKGLHITDIKDKDKILHNGSNLLIIGYTDKMVVM